jgi:hypothetical protein
VNTTLSIKGTKFQINGQPVYAELPDCKDEYRGMLMNARFIQGVFADKADQSRFDRFGRKFDPETNTKGLVEALPSWYGKGLRAITVGFQGGGPCFTMDNHTIENNPYSHDGTRIEKGYLDRMKTIIEAADKIGMVVIVSLFYGAMSRFLDDDQAVVLAVKNASNWLRDNKFTNCIIEIANEHDVSCFSRHPILFTEQGIAQLIETARRESGRMIVGCSGTGGYFSETIAKASDVIIIHANDQPRQRFYNMIEKCRRIEPRRPILCNEDSQCISQLGVAFHEQVSWGYYNNMTKQEPPTDWSITEGEDRFFAHRMAEFLSIGQKEIPFEEQFFLQGLSKHETTQGKRWIRLASLYPEQIDYVDFYRNGKLFATAYQDPFTVDFRYTWIQGAIEGIRSGEEWSAKVRLVDGRTVTKTAIAQ